MALDAYLVLTGETQGAIDGSCNQAGREKSIQVCGFSHEVLSPRDVASGQPTGKRQHKPFVVTCAVDKSYPLLMSSLVNNENITEWTLKCWRPSKTGKEDQFVTYELKNANVASMRTEQLNNRYPENTQHEQRVHIAFTYQKIIWTWNDGGITAEDDWETPLA